jgi:hypothetical protein
LFIGARMDRLVHAHVLLECSQKQRLRSVAAERDASLSQVLRDAVEHYLRMVAGPTPERVRLMARDAVGVLPSSSDLSRPTGGPECGGVS